ncbi:MAG: hypothetical protein IKH04_01070, partial [Kiritimatiellae bacterium]|nr:hypothetical protein [Kiritimatiellia bacterium]
RLGAPVAGVSPWEKRIGVALDGRGAAASETGGNRSQSTAIDKARGTFAVVTPRTCGGFAESGALECGPLTFDLDLPGEALNRPAAVWASSLDGAPLEESRRILVAHVTDARNTGAVFDTDAARTWQKQGRTPALVRRGRAAISLALHGGAAPAVYRLCPAGRRIAEVAASCREGGREAPHSRITVSFTADTALDPSCATIFYEIVRR